MSSKLKLTNLPDDIALAIAERLPSMRNKAMAARAHRYFRGLISDKVERNTILDKLYKDLETMFPRHMIKYNGRKGFNTRDGKTYNYAIRPLNYHKNIAMPPEWSDSLGFASNYKYVTAGIFQGSNSRKYIKGGFPKPPPLARSNRINKQVRNGGSYTVSLDSDNMGSVYRYTILLSDIRGIGVGPYMEFRLDDAGKSYFVIHVSKNKIFYITFDKESKVMKAVESIRCMFDRDEIDDFLHGRNLVDIWKRLKAQSNAYNGARN
jgi:hypothetical protein